MELTALEKKWAVKLDTHPIPAMTDPMGKHWDQPPREEILVDDRVAVMTEKTFRKLHEYSYSNPTGVYPGKMWCRLYRISPSQTGYLLCWYGVSSDPNMCTNNNRPILIV